ncbi:GrlR family regulatory protein [Sphingopyxis sp. GW247-27LB]|uniref:GrlR family regulatory protein n=1 Tax=Sphingopyxis sp. GW247-27LB TaxID=2012632 RepID=UPI000BA70A54|nr:GrlR family regulatory protein [Sphingopyxis sp. GW247-27LB]PAL22345.1 hypothetical protein CD928_09555 [Sphingopyxis sp. GW247-27LB]
MAFKDGFYKVQFGTPLGEGSGVAYLTDGKIYGGDSMMAYAGTYAVNGDQLTTEVNVFTHTNQPGMESTLGVNSATLQLSGQADGNGASLVGSAPQAPHVQLTLKLYPLQA